MLNLILGEQLLPSSTLSTTSTICELKYGDTPKIVAHLKDRNHETKTVYLDKSAKIASQISSFVHLKESRERGSNYEKIELFWPHSLLKVSDRLLRVRYIIMIFIFKTTFGVGLRKRQNVLNEEARTSTILANKSRRLPTADTDDQGLG